MLPDQAEFRHPLGFCSNDIILVQHVQTVGPHISGVFGRRVKGQSQGRQHRIGKSLPAGGGEEMETDGQKILETGRQHKVWHPTTAMNMTR